MKKTLLIIFLACSISACGGGDNSSEKISGSTDLELIESASGSTDLELIESASGSTDLKLIESASDAISALQISGKLPQLDRGISLPGTDGDDNGVRDDIDIYISSLSATSNEKIVIESTARSLQAIQLLDLSATDALQLASDNLTQSVICLSAAFENPADAYKYLKTLEGYTANTPARAQQYNDFNSARDGSVTRLPSSSNCK